MYIKSGKVDRRWNPTVSNRDNLGQTIVQISSGQVVCQLKQVAYGFPVETVKIRPTVTLHYGGQMFIYHRDRYGVITVIARVLGRGLALLQEGVGITLDDGRQAIIVPTTRLKDGELRSVVLCSNGGEADEHGRPIPRHRH